MDALKQILSTRFAQVLARYIGYALTALLVKLGVGAADIQAAVNVDTIATTLGIIISIIIDHYSHAQQQGGGGTGSGNGGNYIPPMKGGSGFFMPMAFAAFCVLPFLAGCFQTPKPIKDATALERQAQDQVTDNQARVIVLLTTAYHDQAYAAIDSAVARDLAKGAATTGGTPQQAMDFAAKIYAQRDAQRKIVDDTCKQVADLAALARSDKVVAQKLRDALDRYDAAQADPAAITKAIADIMARLLPAKTP